MRWLRHRILGSGRGVIGRLAPQTRLICAVSALAVGLAAPARTLAGSVTIFATVLLWLALCRPSAAILGGTFVMGLAVFAPVMLLSPFVDGGAANPWSIFLRGLAAVLISVGAASTLTESDLRGGLVRLPIPDIAARILLQVVHQTSTLVGETTRVSAAMAVRGGGQGSRTAFELLASIPKVWLPRVISRAERVADAMELRGFGDVELGAMGSVPPTRLDRFAIAAAILAMAGAVALRLGNGG